MINKADKNITDVLSQIKDGATIMIGGFGTAGQPAELIDALIDLGVKDLVIINNNAGNGDHGLAKLLKTGAVRKIICSFPANRILGYLMSYIMQVKSSLSWCHRAI